LLTRLRSAAVAPLAAEIVSASLAGRLGLGEGALLLVRLAGNAEVVAAQRDALHALAETTDIRSDVWSTLRVSDAGESTTIRFSSSVARFPELWASANLLASSGGGHAHGSVLRSVCRVALPHVDGTLPVAALDLLRTGTRDVRIFERLPAPLWSSLAPSPVGDRLSRGVRHAFDPLGLLNPGILGEDRT
jgi:hypothetical protein